MSEAQNESEFSANGQVAKPSENQPTENAVSKSIIFQI
jgi:hypothetical protein